MGNNWVLNEIKRCVPDYDVRGQECLEDMRLRLGNLMGQILVEHFPEVETGDWLPDDVEAEYNAYADLMERWLFNNYTPRRSDQP